MKKTETLSVRTTSEIKEILEKEAKRRKWSTSQLIHEIIEEYLRKHKLEEL